MFLHALVISGRIIKPQRIAISWTAILSLALACACAGIVVAKQPTLNSQSPENKKLGTQSLLLVVPLTILHVSVYDRDGKLVDDIQHEAFDVFEDGVRQKIAIFSHEDEAATIGLLIDTSGSMAVKIRAATVGLRRFIQVSNPNDKFFAASFGEHVERVATAEDLDALLAKPAASGRTAMLDALYLGLVELERTRNSRKALLIISDGEDNHSRYSRADIRKLAKEAGVPIYGLLLSGESSGGTQEESSEKPDFLAEICKLSGGRIVRSTTLEAMPNLAAEIGVTLRKQYKVGYYPTDGPRGPNDVRWRKIEVKVQSKGVRGPLKVYAPPGYICSPDGNIL